MFQDPTFWVLVAFIGFISVLVYLKVPGMVTKGLDARAEKIKADLEEADALLKEAQDLLASYQKKQREAADEAQEIQARAKEEAERIVENGRTRLKDSLQRRENWPWTGSLRRKPRLSMKSEPVPWTLRWTRLAIY